MAEYKASSWREQRIEITPEEHNTVYFNDTNPNHILINNSSANPVYFGISAIADSQTYDMIVPGFGSRLYPRMQGTTRIYLYTESEDNIIVNIISWEGTFDPASIPQSQEMVAGGADGLLGVIDVNNFMQPLPAGDNILGSVSIEQLKTPLPPGDNNIGRVTIEGGGQDYTETINTIDYKLFEMRDATNYHTTILEQIERTVGIFFDRWIEGAGGSGGGSGGSGGSGSSGSILMGDGRNPAYNNVDLSSGVVSSWMNMDIESAMSVKEYQIIATCKDEKPAKIKIDWMTSTYDPQGSMLDLFVVDSYIWDKPAGTASIMLAAHNFPAIAAPFMLIGTDVKSDTDLTGFVMNVLGVV